MLQLAYPWLLLVLAVPLIMRWVSRPHREVRPALRVSSLQRLARLTGRQPSTGAVVPRGSWLQRSVLIAVWCLLVLSLARPQQVEDAITKELPGRDLLIAVDLSGSMETKDFTNADGERVDRVTAVKQVLDDFLSRRDGDRVGLIFFGTAPFLQVPFTDDLDVCRALLQEARPRMAGPQTMLGDAIGKAITIFEGSDLDEKVLIVLTDGNDTSSLVPPIKAAGIAKDKGIKIHTIGMGDPTTVGEEELDTKTLEAIASATGGSSFLAIDRQQLEAAYAEIDSMTVRAAETLSFRPVRDLYHWPLAFAIGLVLIYHTVMALSAFAQHVRESRKEASDATTVLASSPAPLGALTVGSAGGSAWHLLRPEFLWLALPAFLLIWLIAQRTDVQRQWRGVIAPRLLDALLVSGQRRRRIGPLHLLAFVLLVGIVALAGPTWRREPSPFTEDQAALVIALKVTPSMLVEDVQPSRLARSIHKIKDLLDQRQGARTALIAYAGSAHLVMPFTRDTAVINSFASELSPDLMPRDGDDPVAVIELATRLFADAGQAGSLLLVTDGIATTAAARIAESADAPIGLAILGVVGAGDDSPESRELARAANTMGAELEFVAADGRDVTALSAKVEHSLASVVDDEGGERWRDEGYWLVPFLCGIGLMWFRPGWVVVWD
ncbi:MAG: VWA domain-containing protein [Gemmatimonadota bacterium]|nr:MAG: VWA domain-containing protein [Gemmatimonadota bacterium]